MKHAVAVGCLIAVCLSGCGDSPAPSAPGTPGSTGAPTAAPASDHATPTKLAEAWIKACVAKDKDAIANCISPETQDGDLKEIRSKAGSDRNYGELADFFGGATVTSESIDPAGDKASVEIKAKRPERFSVVKKDGRWWIMDM